MTTGVARSGPGLRPPAYRQLKVFAFDPALGRSSGNLMTVAVDYEELKPGPSGARIRVVHFDVANRCYYHPVDLDAPEIGLYATRGNACPSFT